MFLLALCLGPFFCPEGSGTLGFRSLERALVWGVLGSFDFLRALGVWELRFSSRRFGFGFRIKG